MVGWGEVTGRAMLPQCGCIGYFKHVNNLQLFFLAYAWDKVPADSVICDIGGGNGHATLGLVKQFPHLKIVVQDLAAVVHQGREVSGSFVLLF
jgi:hypothetical protein